MFSRIFAVAILGCFALLSAFGGPATFTNVNISGNVFNDLNGNGLRGAGEPGLQNWTVLLAGTGLSATSDANGNYTILGVGPGTFTLQEQLQAGFKQTGPIPVPPGTYSITTVSGVNVTGEDFGNQVVPEPSSFGLLALGLGLVFRRNRLNTMFRRGAGRPGLLCRESSRH